MNEHEKQIVQKLASTINNLPVEKKEYILGYAEGVADMVAKRAQDDETNGRGRTVGCCD